MKNDQLVVLLNLLEQSPTDGAISKKKEAMIVTYNKWKHRLPPTFIIDVSLIEKEDVIDSTIGNATVNTKAIASPQAA